MRWHLRPLLVLLLVLGLTGGHLATLQIVAWTGMLVSRAQTSSFTDAISTTFDGEHPCTLCRAVDALQNADAVTTPERKAPGKNPDRGDAKLKKIDPLPMVTMPAQGFAQGANPHPVDDITSPTLFVPGLEPPPPRAG